jgi:phospholipase C
MAQRRVTDFCRLSIDQNFSGSRGEDMIPKHLRWLIAGMLAFNLTLIPGGKVQAGRDGDGRRTNTPIQHVVVIFQENVSFDHYFGTYPSAANPSGEPAFQAKPDTPTVNGLTPALLTGNPNGFNPFRLDRAQALTCDQNHDDKPEQEAFDGGLMDKFVQFTSTGCPAASFPKVSNYGTGIVMGYYDGNTVTGLWNYAHYFSLNENFYGTTVGPSTPGALNLVAGLTAPADLSDSIDDSSKDLENDVLQLPGGATIIGRADPFFDDCGSPDQTSLTSKKVGDLRNEKGITWGWFEGGFKPSSVVNGKPVCATKTARLDGVLETAYSAHHEPFQYYASTSNRFHLPPTSVTMIGRTDQANHQYDLSNFWNAAYSGHLPAVSYLKATRAQDGHPSNSTPLDEQFFLVDTLNKLRSLPEWKDTALFITWDDSDGWYDHQLGNIMNGSESPFDAFTAPGVCRNGASALNGIQGRCGYGPRIPVLVISPYAKENFVDRTDRPVLDSPVHRRQLGPGTHWRGIVRRNRWKAHKHV